MATKITTNRWRWLLDIQCTQNTQKLFYVCLSKLFLSFISKQDIQQNLSKDCISDTFNDSLVSFHYSLLLAVSTVQVDNVDVDLVTG